jgi:hypothetical protein
MNSAIYAAAAQKGAVRRIDNGIHHLLCKVPDFDDHAAI